MSEETNYPTSDLDIDAALASVASLSDVIAEQEAEEAAERAREREAAVERRRAGATFHRPPVMTLRRGGLASVVPALGMIAAGAWLTFALSTGAPSTGLVAVVLAALLGLTLLAYWLSSERWLNGALFGGLSLLFGSGVLVFLAQTNDPAGWPLLLVAVGAALALSTRGRGLFAGVVVIVMGAVAYGVDALALPDLQPIAPVLLVVVLAVLFIPALLRHADRG